MMRGLACLLLATGCMTDFEKPLEVDEPIPDEQGPVLGDYQAFIQCIQFADFQIADMTEAWSTLGGSTSNCSTCHSDAEYSGNAQLFFDALKTRTYVQLKFFSFDGDVVVNEVTIPNVSKALAPYSGHPRFNPNAGMDAVGTLYGFTTTRLLTGNCP
jgi:hypothetical protein